METLMNISDRLNRLNMGKKVRSSIVHALKKINDDNNSYADIKKDIIAAKDAVEIRLLPLMEK